MKPYYLAENPLRKWLVLAAMCVGIFTVAYNTTALMNALVPISNSLHIAPTNLQWLINAYMLASASLIVVGGQLGDMFGRRNLFLIGGCGFILSSLIIATSHHTGMVILGRALQGASAAIITPGTLAIIKVCFAEEGESFAIGIWTALIGLGFAFGPVISGLFCTYASWRYIFWSNLPLMIIAMILTRLFVKKSKAPKQDLRLDISGLILLVMGIFPLTLGLIESNTWSWRSLLTIGLVILGIIMLCIFWIVEHKVKSPLVHFAHFKKQRFVAGNLGYGASIFVLFGILFFFNTLLQNPLLFNYSPIGAGIALLPTSLLMFFVSLFEGKITDRFGFCTPIAIGLILIAVAAFLLHNLSLQSTYHNMWLALSLFGLGIGMSFSASPALAMSALPKNKAGESSGVINTMGYYAGVLSVTFGTLIMVDIGRKSFYNNMLGSHLSKFNVHRIDHAMFGNQESIQVVKQHLSSKSAAMVTHAAKVSAINSFSATMMMCFIAAIIGAVGILWLGRKK